MNNMDLLTSLQTALPLVQSASLEDITFSVTDTKQFLYYLPGKTLNFHIQPGDLIRPGSMPAMVLQSGRRMVKVLPSDLYGVPCVAVGVPLIDSSGKIVGVFSAGISVARFTSLATMAEELSATLQEMTATSQQLDSAAEHLVQIVEQLREDLSSMQDELKELSQVADTVRRIANQIQILGLNAGIEAAHLGQKGASFGVVAQEIRQLSEVSKQYSQTIEEIVSRNIQAAQRNMQKFLVVADTSKIQREMISEISEIFQTIAKSAMQLSEMAKIE